MISLNRLPTATTVNAYDYNAGCGIMASVNEARDVIGALEWQDYQISLKSVAKATVQVVRSNQWTTNLIMSELQSLISVAEKAIAIIWSMPNWLRRTGRY